MRPIETYIDVQVIEDPQIIKQVESPNNKAFIRLTSRDGKVTMDLTLNVCGMIGGMAEGTAKRLGYKW